MVSSVEIIGEEPLRGGGERGIGIRHSAVCVSSRAKFEVDERSPAWIKLAHAVHITISRP